MCHSVTLPRPVPTVRPRLNGRTPAGAHVGRTTRRGPRSRHPPRHPRSRNSPSTGHRWRPTISNDSGGYAELTTGSCSTLPARGLSWPSRDPQLRSRSGPGGHGRRTAGHRMAQPARGSRRGKGKSDPIDAHLAVLTGYGSMLTGCPSLAPTATAKPCGSCSAPATNSPPSTPRRPTAYAPCCWPATTPTASLPAPD